MRKSTKNGDVVADFLMHQTSGAEVTGSNPASPTMILMCCRITVYYFRVMKPLSKNKLKIYFYYVAIQAAIFLFYKKQFFVHFTSGSGTASSPELQQKMVGSVRCLVNFKGTVSRKMQRLSL